jgi:DNA-binding NarL/FixJ family response regulator
MVVDMITIRVVLIDRSEIFVKGLAKVLENEADIEVVAVCPAVEEGVRKIIDLKADVAICGTNAITSIDHDKAIEQSRYIHRLLPNAQFIILTDSENEDEFFLSFQTGVASYLSKYVTGQYLVSTIRRIHTGEVIITPNMARKLLKELTTLRNQEDVAQKKVDFGLTKREIEILKLAASGMGNREVARTLFISEHTVKRHMRSIFQKLKVCSRQQAAIIALDEGIVKRQLTP